MAARSWLSFGLGKSGLRVISSRTGTRLAYRGRHVSLSPRSAFLRVGPFKWFATRRR